MFSISAVQVQYLKTLKCIIMFVFTLKKKRAHICFEPIIVFHVKSTDNTINN